MAEINNSVALGVKAPEAPDITKTVGDAVRLQSAFGARPSTNVYKFAFGDGSIRASPGGDADG